MAEDNGGGNSPEVREIGDAPNITRLLGHEPTKKTYYSSWSSPESFSRHISKMKGSDSWYKHSNVWQDANEDFSGVSSISQALDLCRNGWKEGGETIEKTRGYIRALNPLVNKPIRYAIAGSTPNVPRAIAGNILNMRAPSMDKSSRRKTITIKYNMCEAGFTPKGNIVNKASVMAALIDEIEAKGFSCEVIAIAYTGNSRMDALTSVCVKPSHQPVDINRMAFSLGHSAMFRVLFFADWQMEHFCAQLGCGLGMIQSTKPSQEENDKGIYTISSGGGCMRYFKDLETASTEGLKFLVDELQTQGCPAFPKKDHKDDLDKNEEVPSIEDDDDYDDYDD